MTTERISWPAARWVAIVLTTAFAAAGALEFISIDTPESRVWALVLGAFPLAAWLEARRVRRRGSQGWANQILMAGMGVQLVLWLLAMYAADLATAAGCD
jgi:apolipoprotein N-acyltransferase